MLWHLLLHVGSKNVTRSKGYVADFCPVCRCIRCHEIFRTGKAVAYMGIALGEGKLLHYYIECPHCRGRRLTILSHYASIAKSPVLETPLEPLIQSTYPKIRQAYGERMKLAEDLMNGIVPFDSEARIKMMTEPFQFLNPILKERFVIGAFADRQVVISTSLAFGAAAILLSGVALVPEKYIALWFWSAAAAGATGIVLTFIQCLLAPYRFLRNHLLPALAESLAPFHPFRQEIERVLQGCRLAGWKIGEKVKPDALWSEINKRTIPGMRSLRRG